MYFQKTLSSLSLLKLIIPVVFNVILSGSSSTLDIINSSERNLNNTLYDDKIKKENTTELEENFNQLLVEYSELEEKINNLLKDENYIKYKEPCSKLTFIEGEVSLFTDFLLLCKKRNIMSTEFIQKWKKTKEELEKKYEKEYKNFFTNYLNTTYLSTSYHELIKKINKILNNQNFTKTNNYDLMIIIVNRIQKSILNEIDWINNDSEKKISDYQLEKCEWLKESINQISKYLQIKNNLLFLFEEIKLLKNTSCITPSKEKKRIEILEHQMDNYITFNLGYYERVIIMKHEQYKLNDTVDDLSEKVSDFKRRFLQINKINLYKFQLGIKK